MDRRFKSRLALGLLKWIVGGDYEFQDVIPKWNSIFQNCVPERDELIDMLENRHNEITPEQEKFHFWLLKVARVVGPITVELMRIKPPTNRREQGLCISNAAHKGFQRKSSHDQ